MKTGTAMASLREDVQTANGVGNSPEAAISLDVLVVGAGFAGVYMMHKLRELGLNARLLEAGPSVGGTWFWNRYPGARCDVQSFDYSYSFSESLQQEWVWSERYATQPEILRYIEHVVERFDLRRDMQFNTRVESADFDEPTNLWTLTTESGDQLSARFVVMATGCLSVTKPPSFPGLEDFEGEWLHTGDWPAEGVDFTGRRVGLVGTGSTGIQIAPQAAKTADELFVFQRSPNFSLPAQNRVLDADFDADIKANYADRRRMGRTTGRGYTSPDILESGSALAASAEKRDSVYEEVWQFGGPIFTSSFGDLLVDKESNDTAADFVRAKIRGLVDDPATAALLAPQDHPIGTRRPCVDIAYYETYNKDNVTLVDVRSAAIERITPTGLRTATGDYELDTIIFAIGYDGMTGALLAMDITGVDGVSLRQKWAEGPRSYLGVMVAGFPNLFTVTGPGSPSVLTNMVVSIEQHVEWISRLIGHAEDNDISRIEATDTAEIDWMKQVASRAEATLLPLANSWWTGSNIPGKPKVFMPFVGGVSVYGEIIDSIAARDYEGFVLS
jgi:cation diffusion facilitator CzcD-associated flavoprotein CzcO